MNMTNEKTIAKSRKRIPVARAIVAPPLFGDRKARGRIASLE